MTILVAVARSPKGLTPNEIAEATGLGRQGTYHLLHTLTETGMLARLDRHRYVVGLHVGLLADAFGRQVTLAQHLEPYVRRLAELSGETTYAAGWWNGEIAALATAPGQNPHGDLADVPPGFGEDAHARASGKLLLALVDPEVRDEYLEGRVLRRRTTQTITSREELDDALELVRLQEYAVDLEEFTPSMCCLAVPIRGHASFALCLSAPASRFRGNFQRYLAAAREVASAPPYEEE